MYHPNHSICKDCIRYLPPAPEAFGAPYSHWAPMLKMHIWQTICNDRNDIICIDCTEKKLKRKIEREDLLPCEWNNLMNWPGREDLFSTQEELNAPWIDTWQD
jgi:hypothetical protein